MLSLYPGDLYIIALIPQGVNTFFALFLNFFNETLGWVLIVISINTGLKPVDFILENLLKRLI